jgi:DNA-binding transcriptional LysR family regulator
MHLEEADRITDALQSAPRGTLRVYTSTHIVRFLSPVFDEFLALYPDVSLNLTTGERMVDLIEDGYDGAIRTIPPPDSSLIVRRLTPWRHILCCAPDYMEKRPSVKCPSRPREAQLPALRILSVWRRLAFRGAEW